MKKVLAFYAPEAGRGQTLMVNLVAQSFALKGNSVLIIELDYKFGSSLLINGIVGTNKKPLAYALSDVDSFGHSLIKSAKNKKIFTLCQTIDSRCIDMTSVPLDSLDSIVNKQKEYFDVILLDIPSSITNPFTNKILSNKIYFNIDYFIITVTESARAMYTLFDLANYYTMLGQERRPTYAIINQSNDIYTRDIVPYLKNIPQFEVKGVANVPYIPSMNALIDRGDITATSVSNETKRFFEEIDDIVIDIIKNEEENK